MAFSLPTLAAGVSIPSCHYGRKLVTKTNRKSTVMAPITQPDQLTSSVFASPSSLFLQRNGLTTPRLVAKRSAKVVAMAGTPKYTELVFDNQNSSELILKSHYVWEGDDISEFTVEASDLGIIRHFSSDIGSIGAVALTQKTTPQIQWIVAWSNKTGSDNQMYYNILDYTVEIDWNKIKKDLRNLSNITSVYHDGYEAEGSIYLTSDTPLLRAKLMHNNPPKS